MDIESIVITILGAGSITSVITLLGTYSLNRKQKEQERKNEINDKIIADVYSPLNFYYLQIVGNLGSIIGNFGGFLEGKDDPVEESKQILIDSLKNQNCPDFCSQPIRELLMTRIGFIRPDAFRRELLLYLQLLKAYESQITKFVTEGFNDDLDAEKKWISYMVDVSTELAGITAKFMVNFDKLMTEDNKDFNIVFKKTLSSDTFKGLLQDIYSRNSLYVKSFKEKHKNTDEIKNL